MSKKPKKAYRWDRKGYQGGIPGRDIWEHEVKKIGRDKLDASKHYERIAPKRTVEPVQEGLENGRTRNQETSQDSVR